MSIPKEGKIIFAVGSTNKAKVKAVELAIAKIFPDREREVIAVKVRPLLDLTFNLIRFSRLLTRYLKATSGVRDQPLSDSESIEGARNRAKQSIEQSNAHFGIGLEGGIDKLGDTWFQSGWIAVQDRNGKVGLGSSARYELSSLVMEPILTKGHELATVMDSLSGMTDVRSDQGAMGLLTNGLLPRAECYAQAIIFAFSPFISDSRYWPAPADKTTKSH